MTDNLKLGDPDSTTPLTSTNTDIITNYTLPKADNNFDNPSDPDANGVSDPATESGGESTAYCRTGEGAGKCGYLYPYYTATASTAPDTGDAPYSICPKGWKLPTQPQYQTLSTYITGPWVGSPFYGVLSGGLDDSGSWQYQGSYGHLWTSSAAVDDTDYALGVTIFPDSEVNVNGLGSRKFGISVRCVVS
jgi:hypothetical protein